MLKSLLVLSTTFFMISGVHADSSTNTSENENFLEVLVEAEIQKDLQGKPSCFSGKVKKFKDQMQENYGGRFGDGEHTLSLAEVNSTRYRSYAKYCSTGLDINLNEVTSDQDESLVVYKKCHGKYSTKNIAAITFGASTSGTIEVEGLAFAVNYSENHDLIVKKDADYFPEESDIKSWDITKELTCKLIKL